MIQNYNVFHEKLDYAFENYVRQDCGDLVEVLNAYGRL